MALNSPERLALQLHGFGTSEHWLSLGMHWAPELPRMVVHGLPLNQHHAPVPPRQRAVAHPSRVWSGTRHNTLPSPGVEFPKAGPFHEAVQALLFNQLQDFWLNLLLELPVKINTYSVTGLENRGRRVGGMQLLFSLFMNIPIPPKVHFGIQPMAHGLHAAQDGYECGPTQKCKFTQNSMDSFVITCCNVFNVWPRDAKRLDTPA